jgi:hypothetical protein
LWSAGVGAATSLRLDGRYAYFEPGQAYPVTFVALAGSSLDRSYAGTIHFTSSDPAAVLPADYTFTPQDGGGHNFTVTLNSAGPQWFQVTDGAGLRDRVDSVVGGVTLGGDGTLAVVGRPETDTVSLSAAAGVFTAQLNGAPHTFPAAAVARVDVRTLDQDDSVYLRAGAVGGTINLGDGGSNANRVFVDPGAKGPFTIVGGRGSDELTVATGATAPLHFDGSTLGLDRVFVSGTAGADRFTASDTRVALLAPGAGSAELWAGTFAGVEYLDVLGFGGDDRVDVTPFEVLDGLASLTVDGGDGNDVLHAASNQATGAGIRFLGGFGDDAATLDLGTGWNWRRPNFNFLGDVGTNVLTVNGGTSGTITSSGMTIDVTAVNFSEVRSVTLNGRGAYGLDLRSYYGLALREMTLNLGDDPNYVTVSRVAPEFSLAVNAGGGDDTLQLAYGAVRYDGGAGADLLRVSGSYYDDAHTVTPQSVRWSSASPFADADARAGASAQYTGAERVEVETSIGHDVVTVTGAPAGGGLAAMPRLALGSPGGDDIELDDRGNTAGGTYSLTPLALLRPGLPAIEFGAPFGPYAPPASVRLRTGAGADAIQVIPAAETDMAVDAGSPTSSPGDRLSVQLDGATGAALEPDPAAPGAGRYTFADRKPVTFTGVESASGQFAPTPPAAVIARQLFDRYDIYGAIHSPTGKRALLPGEPASAANVTGVTLGVYGIALDVTGLTQQVAQPLTTADFDFRAGADDPLTWAPASPPLWLSVVRGAGANGSDRVLMGWSEPRPGKANPAVTNAWLRVTLLANDHTRLARPDVFAFGSLVGDTGDGRSVQRVDARDLAAVKRAIASPARADIALDFNLDGRVDRRDLAIVRTNLSRTLSPVVLPAAAQALAAQRRAPAKPRSLFV